MNCSDDRTATHITEHSNNVTAALQPSWKTISVAMKFVMMMMMMITIAGAL